MVRFPAGTEPIALAARADGSFVVGERRTGRIIAVSSSGVMDPVPVATVALAPIGDTQRGLLGLAIKGSAIYASWTRPDGHIVAAQVAPGRARLVWVGPASARLANGGHLAFAADGRLVIGIGDLLQHRLIRDPGARNGKLLALDPHGPPTQRPAVLSDGWNNPFAFTATSDGAIWVADNAPGDQPERLGRGDHHDRRFELPGTRAPAAIVELTPGRLAVCGYLDDALVPIDIRRTPPILGQHAILHGCRTGAVHLADGRLATTDLQDVRIIALR